MPAPPIPVLFILGKPGKWHDLPLLNDHIAIRRRSPDDSSASNGALQDSPSIKQWALREGLEEARAENDPHQCAHLTTIL